MEGVGLGWDPMTNMRSKDVPLSSRPYLTYCYLIGSLDFNFLGNSECSIGPQKKTTVCRGVNGNQVLGFRLVLCPAKTSRGPSYDVYPMSRPIKLRLMPPECCFALIARLDSKPCAKKGLGEIAFDVFRSI